MTISEFAALVRAQLPYEPNSQQDALIDALARFCAGLKVDTTNVGVPSRPTEDRAFILNGYAGTGKTTLTSALVRALVSQKINVVLMAPTGRAAKVFNTYSGYPASTIHRRIYRHSLHGEVPGLKENKDNNTLYIVDEASMIGSASSTGWYDSDLLLDLMTYVFAGTNNRLILMGDTAQLPPVGETESPAMSGERLKNMGLRVSTATLTRIARQGARSGILANSVNIRREMKEHPDRVPAPITENFDDVHVVVGADMAEAIDLAYRTSGIDETMIITRSNRRAADFNKAIRNEVLYYEEELVQNESLLIVKNNYYWTRQGRRRDIDFIANGDIMRVTRVLNSETKYGIRFADVELLPLDARDGDVEPIYVKIFIETLASDAPALEPTRLRALYERIVQEANSLGHEPNAYVRESPYWNALQVKYAYCVTCHKAQGGQWENVFVDIAYINPDSIGPELYRWMYTATTRATRTLTYLVDNPSEF